jgi:hypothetical protein
MLRDETHSLDIPIFFYAKALKASREYWILSATYGSWWGEFC